MSFDTILFSKEDTGVATITLNRPERMNAFNQQMLEDMEAVWKIVREDPEIKCVVLRGAPGRAFCTGVDVIDGITFYPDEPFRERDPGAMLAPKTNQVWKPVIGAVHGLCAGGAFYFLNECDFIICSQDAQFFDPHVSFGVVPSCEPIGASHRMPYGDIMRMILLGNSERISAETALRMSLVSEIVENDKLWTRADELAAIIAAKPAQAVQGAVKAMWEALDMPYSVAVRNGYKYPQIVNPPDWQDRSAFKKESVSIR